MMNNHNGTNNNKNIEHNNENKIHNDNKNSEHQHSSLHPPTYNLEQDKPYRTREVLEDYKVYAGFWMRFWAYIVDILVIGSISNIIIRPVLSAVGVNDSSSLFSIGNILSAILFYSYFVFMTKYFNQTLGKMIFGLKVIPIKAESLTWSTVLFREWVGRYISGFFVILYVLVAFLPKKQGLHDVFADTTVVHERVLLKEPVVTVKY